MLNDQVRAWKKQIAELVNVAPKPVTLDKVGTWPGSYYELEEECVLAAGCALATRRPLLVKGEPGIGKSHLARAFAKELKRPFVSFVVNSRSESQDLLWQFDAIGRLADAQLSHPNARDPNRYVTPGPLWWAFDYGSAKEQFDGGLKRLSFNPLDQQACDPNNGFVVLIDEIDKADVDLPNSLLEALGNLSFPNPYYRDPGEGNAPSYIKPTIGLSDGMPPPLVVITANGEHVLPHAFLRRCVVLPLVLPQDNVENYLRRRAYVHFPELKEEPGNTLLETVIQQFLQDRAWCKHQRLYEPGVAEFIDTLTTLIELQHDCEAINLDRVSHYILGKYQGKALASEGKHACVIDE